MAEQTIAHQSKHTPGPAVTLMFFAGGTYGLKVSSFPTAEAAEEHKRLIAAAPEMRKELEAFLNAIDAWLKDERTGDDTLDSLDDRAASVRALLARIEGQA